MSCKKPFDPGALASFSLRHKNTCIEVLSDLDLESEASCFFESLYDDFESFCRQDPSFLLSYDPVSVPAQAPAIAKEMAASAWKANVGPMAAVAGTFAQFLAEHLLSLGASEVIVENGGDIFLKTCSERVMGIYAGDSDFSGKLGFRIIPDSTPISVCTSSSSVGHSVSLGDSDSVSVVADSASIADAAATAIGNEVKGPAGLELGVLRAGEIVGIQGVLIIRGAELATWGVLPELVRL